MRGIYKVLIGIVVVILLLGVATVGFWYTGGSSLVYVYQNYLTKDIKDKIYTEEMFRDRGPREMLHGYYAGSDNKSFYMWTLSGLKRFFHRDVTSVYYHVDTCGIMKKIEAGERSKEGGATQVDLEEYFDLSAWRERMKPGYYVWVKRVGEGVEASIIDKVWGNSNMTFPIDVITESSCAK